MARGAPCKPGTPSFNQGITNGAAWYPLTGKQIFSHKSLILPKLLIKFQFNHSTAE
jgi:hypothetical protein